MSDVRERLYIGGFLLAAVLLLVVGRDLLPARALLDWGLTFGGTTAAAVLLVLFYRVRMELQASRHELARKEAELNFALSVQKALFPRELPEVGGLEFSAVCLPARGVGGDYYDLLKLPDGRLVFAIADISGKGISAAILMANLQALFRTFAETSKSPSEIADHLNHHLHRVMDDSKFATFFYGEWHPELRQLRYVNAGHNPPILLGTCGTKPLDQGGVPLGIFSSFDFEMGDSCLDPSDLLVLFSDGITDAGESVGREFGRTRLEELVKSNRSASVEEIQHQILAAVQGWSGKEQEDDMTLMIIRATEQKDGPGEHREGKQ